MGSQEHAACKVTSLNWVFLSSLISMVLTNFQGTGIGFGFGVGCGFGVGWGFGGMPMNILGLGAGGGCGVGLGLGWGFGTGFGSQYRSSRLTFQGMEFNRNSAGQDKDLDVTKSTLKAAFAVYLHLVTLISQADVDCVDGLYPHNCLGFLNEKPRDCTRTFCFGSVGVENCPPAGH
ncbi:hypothetical protein POM88_011425 [Heracleum sosnowskyi]|uniref:Glycine-rich protein n=1 Tax=Heracleum sosnowskyi TaxID=360622 RepID=A0AAD8IW80_9APIA|nr:hypothetical protein POM88_011425 [Heracleum sosnowskyi]